MAIRSAAVRDALILVGVFALLLGGLYAYTGTWPPAVIVESGSMMHRDDEVSYGRFGTIDPGDLVLVKSVDGIDDVRTLLDGGKERYGMAGDVIVYYPANDRGRTPIIHRAVAYVEVKGTPDAREYWVRWNPDAPCEGDARKSPDNAWCVFDRDGIHVPSVPIVGYGNTPRDPEGYKPLKSGFITKGDNPVTNRDTDQLSRLSVDERGDIVPVQPEWIEGKGRGELPWLGLIKLSLAKQPNERSPPPAWVQIGNAWAPKDLWVMLGISLFLLVGVPLLYDGYKAVRARQERKREEALASQRPAPAPSDPAAGPLGGPEPPPPGSP